MEYTLRMNRVLDHIDRHLSGSIDLDTLAELAHFSRFHFHRIFTAWMGETLGDYVRRRRLEVGALMLVHQPRKPVIDIALEVGFGSSEAFARAFKLRFGMTPSAWRGNMPQRWQDELAGHNGDLLNSNLDQLISKPDQVLRARPLDDENPIIQELKMNVQMLQKPSVRVAFMRHIGPYGPSVTRFWQEQFLPWRRAHGLDHAPCYGIGHDDPGITPASKCRYDACVVVPDDFVPTSSASITNLPGGRYAVVDFKGQPAQVGALWMKLLRDWLPSSGMQPDYRPMFEYYPEHVFDSPESGLLECQLCLPVRPL